MECLWSVWETKTQPNNAGAESADVDLTAIVAAWPKLPPAVRAGVVSAVEHRARLWPYRQRLPAATVAICHKLGNNA
ncbi:MAG TPA: hypothetical protein VMV69_21230 [Pirellulales bacterium]|nr:hypothetical protein [Pirellulales bacterium]